MCRKLVALLALLPALAWGDVGLYWRVEGTTLSSPASDYSAGDTSASATGGGAISATGALAGSNGISTVDGNDFWDLDSATIYSGTAGSMGFLFRFPSVWPSSGDVFGPQLRNSSAGNNTISFRGDSTNRFELRIGQSGGSTLDYNLTGSYSTATTYFAVGRWDIANDKRAIEVYSVSAGACSLLESREDTTTDLAGASPTSLNQIRTGATTYAGVVYVDNVFVSTEYDEPLQDYCGITAFAPTHSAGPTVGTKTNTTIPISWTASQKGTEYAVACPNGQTANQAQIVAGNCSGGAAVAAFTEASSAGVSDSATLTGLSAGTTYDVYTTFVTDIGGVLASVVSLPDEATTSGGSPPTFSVSPTIQSTNSAGWVMTYTASGASTYHVLLCPPNESTPSAAQVQAGTCASGADGILASEAVTGADTTATGTALLVQYDIHSILVNASGPSSVSSLSAQSRSARSGYAIVTLASVSATSPCDQDSYFTPDVAAGDILEYEIASTPDGYTVTIGTDCDIEADTSGDTSQQRTAISYQDVSTNAGVFNAGTFAADDEWIWNNTAPTISVADVAQIVLTEDAEMDERLMLDVCDDIDAADTLAVSISSGTIPAGTALDSLTGSWTGTPTTEDESGETLTIRCTDPAGEYVEDDITVYVVNTWTVPNCVSSNIGECADLVEAAAPWRAGDPNVTTSGFACDAATATGDIVSQDPAASAEAEAFDSIAVLIDRACGKRPVGLNLGW